MMKSAMMRGRSRVVATFSSAVDVGLRSMLRPFDLLTGASSGSPDGFHGIGTFRSLRICSEAAQRNQLRDENVACATY